MSLDQDRPLAFNTAPPDLPVITLRGQLDQLRMCKSCTEDLAEGKQVSLQTIRGSASQFTCPVCKIVHLAVEKHFPEHPADLVFVVISPDRLYMTLHGGPASDKKDYPQYSQIDIFTDNGATPCDLWFVGVRRLYGTPRADAWARFAAGSLERCRETHGESCQLVEEARLPTRVLDVGTDESSLVKLHISQPGEEPVYTTLSHCWGGDIAIKTTKDTFETKLRGLELSALPPTFRDAVIFTRGLKIRYLWIDSMCIIQDDQQDWAKESVKMGSVYRGATVTIAANMSETSKTGFLEADPVLFAERCRRGQPEVAQVTNFDGSVSTIYSRLRTHHESAALPLGGHPNGESSIGVDFVGRRAWTLQEQLLSQRMVQFLGAEMLWECRTAAWCECMEHGFDGQKSSAASSYRLSLERGILRADATQHSWRDLVCNYLARQLTYSSDFFPALSGYITHLQNSGAGRYLAGIWERQLLIQICWYWAAPTDMERTATYRAPSWSWASFSIPPSSSQRQEVHRSNRLRYAGGDLPNRITCKNMKSKLLATHFEPASHDPNGPAASACIQVKGRVLPLVRSEAGHHLQGIPPRDRKYQKADPDAGVAGQSAASLFYEFHFDPDADAESVLNHFGLLVYLEDLDLDLADSRDTLDADSFTAAGLVLAELDQPLTASACSFDPDGVAMLNSENRVFRRVGLFNMVATNFKSSSKKATDGNNDTSTHGLVQHSPWWDSDKRLGHAPMETICIV